MSPESLIAQIIISLSFSLCFVIAYVVGRQRKKTNKLAQEKAELEKHNQILMEAVNKRPESQPGNILGAIRQSSPEMMARKIQAVAEDQGGQVLPVTKERIVDFLRSQDIVFEIDAKENIALLVNGYVFRLIFIDEEGGVFVVRGALGMDIPADRRAELEMYVSEVHRNRYWPKVVIWETENGALELTVDFGVVMRAGATDKQLAPRVSGAFVAAEHTLTEAREKLGLPELGAD